MKNKYISSGTFFLLPCIALYFLNGLWINIDLVQYASKSIPRDDKSHHNYDCHGLAGMRVLVIGVHMEGNLGDELETTPLLKELKRCEVVTFAYLSHWISHPQRLSARSIREHSMVDEFISFEKPTGQFPKFDELGPSFEFDASILAPGPQRFFPNDDASRVSIDIYFGGSIMGPRCEIPKNVSLLVVREPHSVHCLKSVTENTAVSTPYYMIGDLANSFEPAMATVQFWKEFYAKRYKNFSTLVYVRDETFKKTVHFLDNNTKVDLKPLDMSLSLNSNQSSSRTVEPFRLNCNDILFVSDSPVEDPQFMKWMNGDEAIPGLQQDQFIMLETIEQMFALTQHAQNVYTDRYHPGVIGHRFGKNVQLLNMNENQHTKLFGLHELIQKYPDPKVIQDELIPMGFQKLRDTLRMLRTQRETLKV